MARRASFWEVWWIPSPILEARRLNSECADAAERESSSGPALPLADAAAGDGATWRRALSTAERNSLVRSRNDAGADRDGFMAAADAGSGSGPPRRLGSGAGRAGGWVWGLMAGSVGRGAAFAHRGLLEEGRGRDAVEGMGDLVGRNRAGDGGERLVVC